MTFSRDMTGHPVRESEVAAGLGFASAAEFRAWEADGQPVGECSNRACRKPAFYPHLDEPCGHCGAAVKVERPSAPQREEV